MQGAVERLSFFHRPFSGRCLLLADRDLSSTGDDYLHMSFFLVRASRACWDGSSTVMKNYYYLDIVTEALNRCLTTPMSADVTRGLLTPYVHLYT